jgi:hypothetical protein
VSRVIHHKLSGPAPLAAGTGPNFRKGIDSSGLERAYYEIGRDNPTAAVTFEALIYSLRRGIGAITDPDNQRRLAELSEDQLLALCQRLQNFNPNIAPAWPPEEVEALVSIWSTAHARR